MKLQLLVLLALAPFLGGCPEHLRGSIAGGECKVMERPPYVVQGKAAYDQRWIDNEVEGGIAACGWSRPAARPASLDAAPTVRKAVAPPAKRRSLVKRIRDRILPPKVEAPVAVEPAPEPSPTPTPPLAPRRPIDELLWPSR